ncbi:hypothetical protein PsorP6_013876 [Peronosclerospora sorghi]|uniref:Uncharacterized protein n=1 Tax=Peronosclerospora sorghi TaxID=230839 RepID=A0ACC0VHP8_9STRA|nr:hypothetical protein PsorP6_013876 [Peronosclerospora sorghi]
MTCEVNQLMEKKGINVSERKVGDVYEKIQMLEKQYMKATELLRRRGQTDAFQMGKADHNVTAEVLQLCPQYRKLGPVFENSNVEGTAFDNAGATALSTTTAPITNGSTAGLEKLGRAGIDNEVQGAAATTNVAKDGGSVPTYNRAGGSGGKDDEASTKEIVDVGEEEEGILVDVEEDQSDAEEDKHRVHGHEEMRQEREAEKSEVVGRRKEESSDDDETGQTKRDSNVKTDLNPLPSPSNSGGSSSEGDSSEDGKRESEDGREDEEQTQLAQPDEEGNGDGDEDVDEMATQVEIDQDKGDRGDSLQVSEKNKVVESESDEDKVFESKSDEEDKIFESDEEDKEKEEDMEEIEEDQVDEIPTHEDPRVVGSYSSSSDSEGGDEEEEKVVPTQVQVASDSDIETDHTRHEEAADDAPSSDDADDMQDESESPRKRNIGTYLVSSRTKRARTNTHGTKALERKAFLDRIKQERDQRDEMFQLERAKMMCELETKQVQLALERSLARKKLLSAGVDPSEVERVLPL